VRVRVFFGMAALISDLGVALCSLSTARGFAATAVLTLGLGIALSTFVGKEGVRPEIWSHGHRNVEAAALHQARASSGKLSTARAAATS
jgi:hypothetical protein